MRKIQAVTADFMLELGHIAKNCPEEAAEATEKLVIECTNCNETGHRARDCKAPRKVRGGPMTCRNCG